MTADIFCGEFAAKAMPAADSRKTAASRRARNFFVWIVFFIGVISFLCSIALFTYIMHQQKNLSQRQENFFEKISIFRNKQEKGIGNLRRKRETLRRGRMVSCRQYGFIPFDLFAVSVFFGKNTAAVFLQIQPHFPGAAVAVPKIRAEIPV